jgi:hypothetical protein
MTSPSFRFKNAALATDGQAASGEAANDRFHPGGQACVRDHSGFLIITNGINLNRRVDDVLGYDGTSATALQLLQMRAVREPVAPAVGMMGAGKVFGRDFRWFIRCVNTRTGEFSGLSPAYGKLTNLGTEQPTGGTTYLGQNAYFRFAATGYDPRTDALQLFRNASRTPGVYYLVSQKSTTGVSYVDFVDDVVDEDLINATVYVSDAVPSGPTWAEGIMPPVCRSWQDPIGRTLYFGRIRFGRIRPKTSNAYVTITQGTDLATLNSGTFVPYFVDPGRIGQRITFFMDADCTDPIADPTVYRFQKAESNTSFRIYPELAVSSDAAAGATVTLYYNITDDIDERWTYMSEAGLPWLIDPRKTIAVGDDYDDGPLAWFSLAGEIFVQTKRRIYRASNYASLDPSQTVQFTIAADEGMVGFDSGCVTPAGWAYVHERLGPRIFDGSATRPLDRRGAVAGAFLASSQFANFEPSALESVVVGYDGEHHAVIVSYVPLGQSTLKETMTYHFEDGVWRGPNRERVSCVGLLRSTSEGDVFVTGDDFGSLMTREAQVLDVVPSLANYPIATGTVGAVESMGRIFTASSVDFSADGDERLRGCPIWFKNTSTGAFYFSRIADVLSSTSLELDGPPVTDTDGSASLTSAWTFGIGDIRFILETTYIGDGGEPFLPKLLREVGVRFKRGASGDSTTFEIGVSDDADGTYRGERTDSTTSTIPTVAVASAVYGRVSPHREGATFQIRLRGSSREGTPQIGAAVVAVEVMPGTLP